MLACTDGRDIKSLQHISGDRVIFKNVRRQYKLQDKITVDYILSPKTKTSSHDYVGIYPRNWINLKQFVGFEHTITPPCEEPSLFRCVQFICQPPHVTAVPLQDYQFVYVTQANEVLGKSNFFQFVEFYNEDRYFEETSESPEENFTSQPLENGNIQLTPEEIAYNECYFRNHVRDPQNRGARAFVSYGVNAGRQDEAPSICSIAQEMPHQSFVSKASFKPQRGRPLVKTRDNGCLDFRNSSSQSHSLQNRNYTTYMKNHSTDSFPEMSYNSMCHQENSPQAHNQKWLTLNPWHYQPKQGKWKRDSISNTTALSFGKNDTKRGAIPKQCPKCRAPSDYSYQQQLMQHELAQAHEEIRDLRSEVDHLKHILELSEAGQAKLRVIAEMARKEGRYAIDFVNSLMFNIVTQYRTKIVNFDNSVIYVTRETSTPSSILPEPARKTIYCGRPPSVRLHNGREKELKAIIGRQEMTIRDLHAKLCIANKIIEQASMGNFDVKLELSDNDKKEVMSSPQLTPYPGGGTPRSLSSLSTVNTSTFDLASLGEVLNSINVDHIAESSLPIDLGEVEETQGTKVVTMADVHRSEDLQLDSLASQSLGRVQELVEDTVTMETKYYSSDNVQFWNCGAEKNVDDSEDGGVNHVMPNETNNNNYDSENMNSNKISLKSKCDVCEPASSDICGSTSTNSGQDLN